MLFHETCYLFHLIIPKTKSDLLAGVFVLQ